MKRARWVFVGSAIVAVTLAVVSKTGLAARGTIDGDAPRLVSAHPQQAAPASAPTAAATTAQMNGVVDKYCTECHNERMKRGNLVLTGFDLAHPGQNAEVAREDDPQAAGGHDAAARRRAPGSRRRTRR